MARFPSVRLFCAGVFVVLLSSCAGGPTAGTSAATAAGAGTGSSAATATEGGTGGTSGGGTSESQRGNPGGPGGSNDDSGGTDVIAGGNPGAPGDVAVFEEAGVPHSVLRDDAANKCADGVCTLLEPSPTAGHPDDVGGLDECIIQKQSDIHYDPPEQHGLFRKGATVQADVDCTATDSSTETTRTSETTQTSDTTGATQENTDGTGGSTSSDSATSSSSSSSDATASDGAQG
jgi:hypothetical protein